MSDDDLRTLLAMILSRQCDLCPDDGVTACACLADLRAAVEAREKELMEAHERDLDGVVRAAVEAEREALMALFVDHYWNSLSKDKELILEHIKAVLAIRARKP
jgi:type II secretory pathway predicted ATPase ExeA